MSGNNGSETPAAGKIDSDSEPMLYSVERVAEKLGIGKRTAWDLVWAGVIPSKRLGNRRLVTAQALQEYVANLPDGEKSPRRAAA